MRHIIHDADSKARLGITGIHIIVYRLDLSGVYILGAKTIPPAIDDRRVFSVGEGSYYIQIHRLTDAARLSRPIQNRDLSNGRRQSTQEMLHRERPIQMDLKISNFFTAVSQIVNDFPRRLANRAHSDDDPLCIRCAVVIEEMVFATRNLAELVQVTLYYFWQHIVLRIAGLCVLEVHIWPLNGGTDNGVVWVHGSGSPCLQCILIHQSGYGVQINHLDLLDFMGCPEAVEEVDEWDICLDGSQVSHSGQIHDFLYATSGEHSHTCGTAVHHILMITKNGISMGTNTACGHMQYAGVAMTCDDMQAGDHQHQALGGSKRCCQGTTLQRTMYCADRACLRLHLYQGNRLPKHILSARCSPFICQLCHWGGRRDRIDPCNFGELVCNSGTCLVSVHGFHSFRIHDRFPHFLFFFASS